MIKIYDEYYELKIEDFTEYLEADELMILGLIYTFNAIFLYRKNDVWPYKEFVWDTLTGKLHCNIEKLNEEEFIIILNNKKMAFNIAELTEELINDLKRDKDKFKESATRELAESTIESFSEKLYEFKKEYEID